MPARRHSHPYLGRAIPESSHNILESRAQTRVGGAGKLPTFGAITGAFRGGTYTRTRAETTFPDVTDNSEGSGRLFPGFAIRPRASLEPLEFELLEP